MKCVQYRRPPGIASDFPLVTNAPQLRHDTRPAGRRNPTSIRINHSLLTRGSGRRARRPAALEDLLLGHSRSSPRAVESGKRVHLVLRQLHGDRAHLLVDILFWRIPWAKATSWRSI